MSTVEDDGHYVISKDTEPITTLRGSAAQKKDSQVRGQDSWNYSLLFCEGDGCSKTILKLELQ